MFKGIFKNIRDIFCNMFGIEREVLVAGPNVNNALLHAICASIYSVFAIPLTVARVHGVDGTQIELRFVFGLGNGATSYNAYKLQELINHLNEHYCGFGFSINGKSTYCNKDMTSITYPYEIGAVPLDAGEERPSVPLPPPLEIHKEDFISPHVKIDLNSVMALMALRVCLEDVRRKLTSTTTYASLLHPYKNRK